MYLSKIEVNKSQVSIADTLNIAAMTVYKTHKLACAFAGGPQKRYLYRLEKDRGGWPMFYLLSDERPQFDDSLWICEPKVYNPKISTGEKLKFILRANPVKVHKRFGKRLDAYQYALQHHKTGTLPATVVKDTACEKREAAEASCLKWLNDRASESGFRILESQVQSYSREIFQRKGESVTIGMVDFHGVLNVADPDKFLSDCLFKGIGRAKGFGCGLMLVRRV
jgi:CRISPR system Cascade subunit CasE